MTYQEIRKNKEVLAFLEKGNANLGVLGFTDHSQVHCTMVAERAAYILETFGYGEHEIELAKIAGFMHDIGNAINRAQGIKLPDAGADAMTTEYIPAPEIFLVGAVATLLIFAIVPLLSRVSRAHREKS